MSKLWDRTEAHLLYGEFIALHAYARKEESGK